MYTHYRIPFANSLAYKYHFHQKITCHFRTELGVRLPCTERPRNTNSTKKASKGTNIHLNIT